MPGHESDGMVVKLPAERVSELLSSGIGAPVAPAGAGGGEVVLITDGVDPATGAASSRCSRQ